MTCARPVTHPPGEQPVSYQPARRARGLLGLATALVLAGGGLSAGTASASTAAPAALDRGLSTHASASVRVVVSGAPGADTAVRRAVVAAGGTFLRPLSIVHGTAAAVPANHLAGLARAAGVTAVTADRQISLAGNGWDDAVSLSPYAWTSQATSTWAQTGKK